MIVTAEEVRRSFRGAVDLLNRRVEGLQFFDVSEGGFWRSFAAIVLTLPAYVVAVAAARPPDGPPPAGAMLADIGLDLSVAVTHVALFLALPATMIALTRRTPYAAACVPFVIVTNWLSVGGILVLALPSTLLLLEWATPELAATFTLGFAVVLLRLHWFATKVTLGVSGGVAGLVVALGVFLNAGIGGLMRAVV